MKTQSALEDVLPLAPLQEGFLFHALYDGQAPDLYTVQLVLRVEGPLDAAVMRASAAALLARHANLRAGFRTRKSGQAIQVIHREVPLPWREIDLRQAGGEAELEELLAADRAARFDLARPPLLRLSLFRLADEEYCLALTSHHILLDGWSTPLLLDELFTLYERGGSPPGCPASPLPRLPGLAGPAGPGRGRAGLAGRPRGPGRADPRRPRRGRRPALPERVALELSPELTGKLTATARSHRLTMSTLVQGAWAAVLGGLTGRDDVVFGTTVSTRPAELPGSEAMVGLFINTIPVRARLDRERSLLENLVRFQDEQTSLLPHQYLGLGRIQQLAGLGDLFDTTTVFENYPMGAGDDDGTVAGLRLTEADGRDATHYALNLVGDLAGDRLNLRLDYRADRFDRRTAQDIATRVRRLLESAVTEPAAPLGRVDLVGEEERALLLGEGDATAHPVPATTLPALFAAQAARTPGATAVVCEDTTLTYAELDERADRLAALLAERGAGPERLVALALPRSADMVVALLGVLKSGAAYLPVDPGHPRDRVAFTLTDAAPLTVLTTADTAAVLDGLDVPLLVLDSEETRAALAAPGRPPRPRRCPPTRPTPSTPPAPPAAPRASSSNTAPSSTT
ncbi:condensation domain-containing protein [Streptomyces stramineus]